MGCLKSILKKIIIIAIIIAFFALGGYSFVKQKIHNYQNPLREEFVKTEKNYGDFSSVSSNYQLCRNFNFLGYKKITAKYLPTSQKITIYDLKNEDMISCEDFKNGTIDKKIDICLNKLKDSFITFENFEIVKKGTYFAKNKKIPYIVFNAKVKNVPFKNVSGVVACYSTKNEKQENMSSKLVVTMTDIKAFNPVVVKDFVQAIKF